MNTTPSKHAIYVSKIWGCLGSKNFYFRAKTEHVAKKSRMRQDKQYTLNEIPTTVKQIGKILGKPTILSEHKRDPIWARLALSMV